MSYSNYPEVLYDNHPPEVVPPGEDRTGLKQSVGTENRPGDSRSPFLPDHDRSVGRRQICGVSFGICALITALVALLIAAAVGGGVGGALSDQHCNNKLHALESKASNSVAVTPTVTVTSIATGSATATSSATAIPTTGCQDDHASDATYTTTWGSTFSKFCNYNYEDSDLIGVVTASWDLCMEACGSWNHDKNGTDPTYCVGLSYVPSWVVESYATGNVTYWSNCFLKYSTVALTAASNTLGFEVVVSNLLQ